MSLLSKLLLTTILACSVFQRANAIENYRVVKSDKATHQFIDSAGRARFFHGTNVVFKDPPYHPVIDHFDAAKSFSEEDARLLSELGINSIRLGVLWAGVEPVRGVYDQKYIDVAHKIIQFCAKYNIYVLIDMHQDVLAPQFCGEGAPEWFAKPDWVSRIKKFPFPQKLQPFKTDARGIPLPGQCGTIRWDLSYLTMAVGNAFGRLYNNYDGLGDSFAAYWKKLAIEFGKYSNILGYNLMNEPWAGDTWADPTLLVPGVADKKVLEPLWNKCNQEIRKVDNETLIFFEGVTWNILSGFNNVPGGAANAEKTVLSWHYYKPPQLVSIEETYKNRVKDMNRLSCGGMLTEFTMWHGNQAQRDDILHSVQVSDQFLHSWTGWVYKSFEHDGNAGSSLFDSVSGEVRPDMEPLNARTYASAVAGIAKSMHFDDSNGSFTLEWVANPKIMAPTEINFSKRINYPNGYTISTVPENVIMWRQEGSKLLITYTGQVTQNQVLKLVMKRT
ncbi:hypothetical protein K7432_010095 [Basidiobolus ranarum]|uniref:Uncharacterized protein n=1 Tax=Basidiobolus ranarum TaxID=34480 RepID=A0ABR2VW58_9FUNG